MILRLQRCSSQRRVVGLVVGLVIVGAVGVLTVGCAQKLHSSAIRSEPDREFHFEHGEIELAPAQDPQVEQTLAQVLVRLREQPKAKVLVVGHADSTGSDELNQHIARERAAYIAERLSAKDSQVSQRLVIASYGESSPIANNGTKDGRAKNRRVSLHIYQPHDSADESKLLRAAFDGRLQIHGGATIAADASLGVQD